MPATFHPFEPPMSPLTSQKSDVHQHCNDEENKENVDPNARTPNPVRLSTSCDSPRQEKKGPAVDQPPFRGYLDRLPPEILSMICENLKQKSILALRLQCRYLCNLVTPRMLHTVHVRFKKTSIEAMLEVSKHTSLNQNVTTIAYEPNLLRRMSKQQWQKDIPLPEYHKRPDPPEPPKSSASEREWRLHKRSMNKHIQFCDSLEPYTQKEQAIAWPIYQRYMQEQDDMVNREYASQDFHQAILRFPNVTAFHLNIGNGLSHGSGWTADLDGKPYLDGLCDAQEPCQENWQYPGVYQIIFVMQALATAGARLSTLKIGCLDWYFFIIYENHVEEFEGLTQNVKSIMKPLHVLKFVITTWSVQHTDSDEGPEIEIIAVEECRDYFRNGSLGRLLSEAPDLRNLAITFDAFEIQCPIDFQYLALDTHWQHLHTVEFECINTDEDSWIGFFERHAGTLRFLDIGTIRLVSGNWSDVLERMQALLSLEKANMEGHLIGNNPIQWWTLGCDGCKDSSVQENRTRWALEEFMIRGGICPLRDQEAHPQVEIFD